MTKTAGRMQTAWKNASQGDRLQNKVAGKRNMNIDF